MMTLTHLPLDASEIAKMVEKWTPEDREAAALDVILYGNVCVVAGRYVPWNERPR